MEKMGTEQFFSLSKHLGPSHIRYNWLEDI